MSPSAAKRPSKQKEAVKVLAEARDKVRDLQIIFLQLQQARRDKREGDGLQMEERMSLMLREWEAQLKEPISALLQVDNSSSSDLSTEMLRMLQLHSGEEVDDASSAPEVNNSDADSAQENNCNGTTSEPRTTGIDRSSGDLTPSSGDIFRQANQHVHAKQIKMLRKPSAPPSSEIEPAHQSSRPTQMLPSSHRPPIHSVSPSYATCQSPMEDQQMTSSPPSDIVPEEKQCNSAPSDLCLFPSQSPASEVPSHPSPFAKTICSDNLNSSPLIIRPPSPSAFLGPTCCLWDCSRPANVNYCCDFHSVIALKEGAEGNRPLMRPGGLAVTDGRLFEALQSKLEHKDVGIPFCEKATTGNVPWDAPETFNVRWNEKEILREWLLFDQPQQRYTGPGVRNAANRRQRNLEGYSGRGWHESRKVQFKENGGFKRVLYLDPQPDGDAEWYLHEYELSFCLDLVLHRLGMKRKDRGKGSGRGKDSSGKEGSGSGSGSGSGKSSGGRKFVQESIERRSEESLTPDPYSGLEDPNVCSVELKPKVLESSFYINDCFKEEVGGFGTSEQVMIKETTIGVGNEVGEGVIESSLERLEGKDDDVDLVDVKPVNGNWEDFLSVDNLASIKLNDSFVDDFFLGLGNMSQSDHYEEEAFALDDLVML